MSWINPKSNTGQNWLFGHLPLISQTIQLKWTWHVGHCWRSKDKLISGDLLWTLAHRHASVGWPTKTYISSVWTQDAAKKTYQEWWMIEMDGRKELANSVLSSWHNYKFNQSECFRWQYLLLCWEGYQPWGSQYKDSLKVNKIDKPNFLLCPFLLSLF